MLLSPLVPKGAVFQEPNAGPSNTSQFEHTSVPATLKKLFNLTGFLTKRDAWAGTFDELLLDAPRADTPVHLPEAPAPAQPWGPIPNGSLASASARGGVQPQHCSHKVQHCLGAAHATQKQRNTMRLLADLLPDAAAPEADAMDVAAADAWLREHWGQWLARDDGYDEL